MSLGIEMYNEETPFDVVLARAVSADHEIEWLRERYLKQIEVCHTWRNEYDKLWTFIPQEVKVAFTNEQENKT